MLPVKEKQPENLEQRFSQEKTMKPYVIPLSDPQANLETVGGKGMSLAKLARAGLPVPGGFHVPCGWNYPAGKPVPITGDIRKSRTGNRFGKSLNRPPQVLEYGSGCDIPTRSDDTLESLVEHTDDPQVAKEDHCRC